MGRRYDDEEKPRGEWRFLRFLGGMVLGVIVSAVILTWMAVTLPSPVEEPAADAAGETAPEDTQEDAAAGQGETGLAALPSPVPQLTDGASPAPAPDVAAPGQPAPQAGAAAPETFGQTDSAVEGDFGVADETVTARAPGAVEAPEEPLPPATQGPVLQLEGPAIEVNAARFEPPVAGEPLLAVVLSDAGASGLSRETLLSLPAPLTLSIVPRNSEDATLAAEAKLAGYEIVAELPLGTGDAMLSTDMSAQEIADSAEARMTDLWMAIGAMPRVEGEAELEERIARALLGVLERHGFAFVGASVEAESEAREVADAYGVPYARPDAMIPADASAQETYAALDSVAGVANASGHAVISGPASRPMLEGLLRWWLEKNGRQARLAPLSAVIAAERAAPTAGAN